MSTDVFPTLPAGFSYHRKPRASTRVFKSVSGREVTQSLYAKLLFDFEITYEGLSDSATGFCGIPASSLQTIEGFFLDRQGQYDAFLYQDPSLFQATGVQLGTGDGTVTAFPLLLPVGTLATPVDYLVSGSLTVFSNGSPLLTGYTLANLPATVTFGTAPASGAVITATYQFYFQCRFDGDDQDYENFLYQLWTLKSCKLRQVKN